MTVAAAAPRFNTLSGWLDWQAGLHPTAIELGLDRVRSVAEGMALLQPSATVITVAGTNGKGSVIALLESMLHAHGYHVASYTSPHILHYNERIRLNGTPVDDAAICAAFHRVDQARDGKSLTYFEFGTLAALDIFSRAEPDVMLLEVGLGGRLDAVNVIDADVSLVTSIDLDHCAWLGDDREAIGREKAGIFRAGRPAICADRNPPASLQAAATRVDAQWFRIGQHFDGIRAGQGWDFSLGQRHLQALPLPSIAGSHQLDNAAAALAALQLCEERLSVTPGELANGLQQARLPGRCEIIAGEVEYVIDVAHNPASARMLAAFLRTRPPAGRCRCILGMLDDKDVAGFVTALAPSIDDWCVAGLGGERGLAAEALAAHLPGTVRPAHLAEDVAAALTWIQTVSRPGDRVVVCGSFQTVAAAMASRV